LLASEPIAKEKQQQQPQYFLQQNRRSDVIDCNKPKGQRQREEGSPYSVIPIACGTDTVAKPSTVTRTV